MAASTVEYIFTEIVRLQKPSSTTDFAENPFMRFTRNL